MILFKDDYLKHNVVYHFTTKNISAIRIAKILKSMGIQNNKFMLVLYDGELANYDPHHLTDPSIELRQRIVAEMKLNPWYFYREIVRIPQTGKPNGVPFEFNRGNLCLIWCVYTSTNIMLVMPRQIGKSVGTQSISSHLMYIAGQKYDIGSFAKDQSLVQQNVIRLKEIKESIPGYAILKSVKDTDNKEGLSYTALNNNYKTFTAQLDVRAAERQGRGETFPLVHFDEAAWYNFIWLSYSAATGSMGAARGQALEQGLPSCVILTTTAGRVDDPRGAWANNYMLECFKFYEGLYDKPNIEEFKQFIDENSKNGGIYAEFSYKQLGKSEAWFKEITRDKDQDTIDMDYLNKWLSGREGKALPTELLNSLSIEDPLHYSEKSNFVIRWYVDAKTLNSDEFKNKTIFCGMDTGDNVGIDFSTVTLIDVTNGATIATIRNNSFNLTLIAKIIYELMIMFPHLLFIPERNKNGATVVDNLILLLIKAGINPFKRIFNKYTQEYNPDDYKQKHPSELDPHGVDRKYLGFTTNKSTREILYSSVLVSSVTKFRNNIKDSSIITELKSLIIKNGRVDHPAGGHDDQVISWLLTMFVLFNGKNLNLYSIDIASILSGIDMSGSEVDPIKKREQIELHKTIIELEEKIQFSSDYVKDILSNKIRELKSQIDDSIDVNETNIRLELEKKNYKEEPGNNITVALDSLNSFNRMIDTFYQRG